MKKVFFDTNVFNRLFDDNKIFEKVISLKENGKVEIYSSTEVFEQLIHTYDVNPDRAKGLCIKFSQLVDKDKIVMGRLFLLLMELMHFKHGKGNPSIILSGKYKDEFLEELKKLLDERKKKNFNGLRGVAKERKQYFDDKIKAELGNYETFYKRCNELGAIKEALIQYFENLLNKKIVSEVELGDKDDLAVKTEAAIDKLSHFKCATSLHVALAYRYSIEGKKAKHGDLEDLGIIIAASTLDVFVSDDEGAREMFRTLFPQKNVYSTIEFIKEY